MSCPRMVLDTNVLVAAIRSRRGASFRLLEHVGTGRFELVLTVPLVLEYEDAMMRHRDETALSERDIRDLIDYLCQVSQHQPIFFLWRPYLRDPKDDLVLEAAVAGGCDGVVTFNVRDFAGSEQFGLWIEPPRAFLARIGVIS